MADIDRFDPHEVDTFELLRDGSVVIRVTPEAHCHVQQWLPFSASLVDADVPIGQAVHGDLKCTIDVEICNPSSTSYLIGGDANNRATENYLARFTVDPIIRLGGVDVHLSKDGESAITRCKSGIAFGSIDLTRRQATIRITPNVAASRGNDVSAQLTLCVALLMGRIDRALMHAAAVVPPDGDAWILVGDSHSGKTTTTMNLMISGWQYLSDDHVVIGWGSEDLKTKGSRVEESEVEESKAEESNRIHNAKKTQLPGKYPTVEGWPRVFHLDSGWGTETPKNIRCNVDPRQYLSAHKSQACDLGGMLFPVVEANEATKLIRISGAEALAGIVRQSPWLMADHKSAASTFALFTAMCKLPAYQLRLGLDTFNNPGLLAERMALLR